MTVPPVEPDLANIEVCFTCGLSKIQGVQVLPGISMIVNQVIYPPAFDCLHPSEACRFPCCFLKICPRFFLTPPSEKTKIQRQNSRKKLNVSEDFPSRMQTSRKKLKFMKFSPQNSKFSKGWNFLYHFY